MGILGLIVGGNSGSKATPSASTTTEENAAAETARVAAQNAERAQKTAEDKKYSDLSTSGNRRSEPKSYDEKSRQPKTEKSAGHG